jgi:hypothetical protein
MDDSCLLGRKALRCGNKDIELEAQVTNSPPNRAICCVARARLGYIVFTSESPKVCRGCPRSRLVGTLASIITFALLCIPHVLEIVKPCG